MVHDDQTWALGNGKARSDDPTTDTRDDASESGMRVGRGVPNFVFDLEGVGRSVLFCSQEPHHARIKSKWSTPSRSVAVGKLAEAPHFLDSGLDLELDEEDATVGTSFSTKWSASPRVKTLRDDVVRRNEKDKEKRVDRALGNGETTEINMNRGEEAPGDHVEASMVSAFQQQCNNHELGAAGKEDSERSSREDDDMERSTPEFQHLGLRQGRGRVKGDATHRES